MCCPLDNADTSQRQIPYSHMNDVFSTAKSVAVILSRSEGPQVLAIPDELGSELVLESERFRDSGSGDWLGFYDWLRAKSGEVIGVRLWVDDVNPQMRAAGQCVGVVTAESCFPFLIYLGAEREFEDEQSCDQDFGGNRLMVSSNKFVLTFNAPSSL